MPENTVEVCDESPVNISVDAGYALVMDGSFSVTTEFDDVQGFNDDLFLVGAEADRFVNVKLLDPIYYIKTTFDLNSKINRYAGGVNDLGTNGSGSTSDDAWSMEQIVISKTGSSGETGAGNSYNLPTGSENDINVSKVTATDGDGAQTTYSLDFNMEWDANGETHVTSHEWSGADMSGNLVENIMKAQKAFWTNVNQADFDADEAHTPVDAQPTVAQNDKDTLNAVLTKSDLEAYAEYATGETTAFNAMNDQDLITEWVITLDAVPNDQTSNLTAFARNVADLVHPGSNDPFSAGDQVIVETPTTIDLSFTDNVGTEFTIYDNATVYGVVEQSN
jgi:hypothetical protein